MAAIPSLDLGFSTSASASVGGGNVLNAAPLFGDYFGQGGSSNGNNPADASASASAGKGAGATAANPVAPLPAATLNLSTYLPYLLLGAVVIAGVFVVVEIFNLFKK